VLFLGYSLLLFGGIYRKSPSSPISMRVFTLLRSGGIPPRVRLTAGTRTPVSLFFRPWIRRRPNSGEEISPRMVVFEEVVFC
jgi:hypothetical protein